MNDAAAANGTGWYAAMVKPALEPVTAAGCARRLQAVAALAAAGFEVYRPMVIDTRPVRCPGSKRRPCFVAFAVPLTPGYVFVHMARHDLFEVRSARGVVDVVRGEGRVPLPAPAGVVEALMAAEDGGTLRLSREQRRAWKAGDLVRVIGGVFASHSGRVSDTGELDRQGRITAELSLFGRLTPVSLDVQHLERRRA